jgi:hypothetical protein
MGELHVALSALTAAVALVATALGKASGPPAGRKVGRKGRVAREGGDTGGGPRLPQGVEAPLPGDTPSAAAKAAGHSSPSRRARNKRRAIAFCSAKGRGPAGDGELAPAAPVEEEAISSGASAADRAA